MKYTSHIRINEVSKSIGIEYGYIKQIKYQCFIGNKQQNYIASILNTDKNISIRKNAFEKQLLKRLT